MSLLRTIRDAFFPPCAPTLRNTRGGMAFVKPYGIEYGAGAITGQVVKTVRLMGADAWIVDPKPRYVLTSDVMYEGRLLRAGTAVAVFALSDSCLEPIKNPGDDATTEERSFQPPVPARERETA